MSYSLQTPCWACSKGRAHGGECRDEILLSEGIQKIHENTYETGHQGGGYVVMMCVRMNDDLKKRED